MRADGQKDMTKLTVAFRNFANAPKNCSATSSSPQLLLPTWRRLKCVTAQWWSRHRMFASLFTDHNLSHCSSTFLPSLSSHHFLLFIIPHSCYVISFSFSSLCLLPFYIHILFITVLIVLLPLSFLVNFAPLYSSSFLFLPLSNSLQSYVARSGGALPCACTHRRRWPAPLRLHTDGTMWRSTRRAYVSPQDGIWKSQQEQEWDRSCSNTEHASLTADETRRKGNAAPPPVGTWNYIQSRRDSLRTSEITSRLIETLLHHGYATDRCLEASRFDGSDLYTCSAWLTKINLNCT
jgi:hypothetical protein